MPDVRRSLDADSAPSVHLSQDADGAQRDNAAPHVATVHPIRRVIGPAPEPLAEAGTSVMPRAIVVDDDATVRFLLARTVRELGYEVVEAARAATALSLFHASPTVLVVSDLNMPGMSGLELVAAIRAADAEVAIVMTSGVTETDQAVTCMTAGADDYLVKPFEFFQARVRIAAAADKGTLRREVREHRQHLESELTRQRRLLDSTVLGGVEALVDALEAKDPYTRGHSERVSAYGRAIAEALGLSADIVAEVTIGGRLHDIGKIGVRESVLDKAGELTAEEYAHVMTHPVRGWSMVRRLVPDAEGVLSVIRSHHERWDGAGIPDRLPRETIPLVARIVAAADTFDALTSLRPYRGARSRDFAMLEIERCAGSQFDPAVAQACRAALASVTP